MSADKKDRRRWLGYLQDERETAALYRALAEAETRPEVAEVYRRLAEVEERHARYWEDKLRAPDGSLPAISPSLRSRVLGWLARRFGPDFVLPALVAGERKDGTGYRAEPGVRGFQAEEDSHARVLSALAGSGAGLEGGMVARLEGRHRTIGGNAMRAAVLGVNDGLVSNLSLVMGVAGAALSSQTILITGLAGLLAGACSMAMGEWLSVRSSSELAQRQLDIEAEELREKPEEEAEELALIYQAKGLPEADARQLARSLMADPKTALDTLAREELGLNPEEHGGAAWEAAGASFALFVIGAIVPVLPFAFMTGQAAVIISLASSALALFLIGAATTLMTGRGVLFSGMRQLLIGLGAAAITYGTGRLLGVTLS
ncbi:MAG: VIT1/CCC1 transporter family protein [bacterium]